jgi:hypothetical protein
MRVKRTYLTLLAAAVVGGCVLRLLEAGVAGFSSARSLGQTVGGIGAFFLARIIHQKLAGTEQTVEIV